MAAETRFGGSLLPILEQRLGAKGVQYNSIGYGHNQYLGFAYVGGLPAALIVTFALILPPILALLSARKHQGIRAFILVWGASASIGYAVAGLLSGTFGDRSTAFFYGAAMGLIWAAQSGRSVARKPYPTDGGTT